MSSQESAAPSTLRRELQKRRLAIHTASYSGAMWCVGVEGKNVAFRAHDFASANRDKGPLSVSGRPPSGFAFAGSSFNDDATLKAWIDGALKLISQLPD